MKCIEHKEIIYMTPIPRNRAQTIVRVLQGLIFTVFGLNGLLRFIPFPPPPEQAAALLEALWGTGYLIPLLTGIEVLSGVLLLSNRLVPLALAILAPIIVNICMFHAFLAPAGLPIATVVLSCELFLAWSYRAAYRPLLAEPNMDADRVGSGRAVAGHS
jgi:hypothetical protein